MAKTYPCERVDATFLDTAPFRFVSTVDLAITPEQVFEVFGDAESWPHWATVITKVTWTSPEPRGGSVRRGRSPCAAASPAPRSFLPGNPTPTWPFGSTKAPPERSRRLPRIIGWCAPPHGGCHLTWVMAMKPNGIAARLGMEIGRPVMSWLFQRFLHNLVRYAQKRFSTSPPTPHA